MEQCPMVEANRQLGEMVSSMQDIGAASDKIAKIIKIIDEIAFQTNILALNAAVAESLPSNGRQAISFLG